MKLMKLFTTTLLIFASLTLWSQGQIGINTNNPDPSAVLDIQSDSQGMLIPRMTSTQISNINNPANGLQVFNTTLQASFFFNGTTGAWQQLSSIWKLNGDSVYYNTGNVGIGTSSPRSNLHIEDNNPRFQMTNGNDISMIIDLDPTEESIDFIGEINGLENLLFNVTQEGKFGIGINKPLNLLHIKSDTPRFSITNLNLNSMIIDLDPTEESIDFYSDQNGNEKKLFSVTLDGNFGIGSHFSDTTLHLKDISPFIKYTNSNNIDFLLGLKDSDNTFTLMSPSLSFDFINASSLGALSLTASSPISINPGLISPNLALFNPLTFDTIQIEVDSTGGLSIPSTSLADRANFLRMNIAADDSLFFGSSSTLSLTTSSLSLSSFTSTGTNYTLTNAPSDSVIINSEGFYSLNFGLMFKQVETTTINPSVKIVLKVNGNILEENIFGVWSQRLDLITMSKIYKFEENDVISFEMSVFSHNNTLDHDVLFKKEGSYIEFIKISN